MRGASSLAVLAAAAAMRVPLRHPQMAILTTADLPSHAQSPQGFDAFPFAYHEELTLQIESLTNMGDGVARVELDADSRWVVFVPYVLPGELVRARVYRNDRGHSRADLLEVLKPSAARVKPACVFSGSRERAVECVGRGRHGDARRSKGGHS